MESGSRLRGVALLWQWRQLLLACVAYGTPHLRRLWHSPLRSPSLRHHRLPLLSLPLEPASGPESTLVPVLTPWWSWPEPHTHAHAPSHALVRPRIEAIGTCSEAWVYTHAHAHAWPRFLSLWWPVGPIMSLMLIRHQQMP